MVSAVDTNDVARRAEIIYADRLRSDLERDHRNEFVAIEPDSGDYYLGKTPTEAIGQSRAAHPGCLSFIIRVGHTHAIQLLLLLGRCWKVDYAAMNLTIECVI